MNLTFNKIKTKILAAYGSIVFLIILLFLALIITLNNLKYSDQALSDKVLKGHKLSLEIARNVSKIQKKTKEITASRNLVKSGELLSEINFLDNFMMQSVSVLGLIPQEKESVKKLKDLILSWKISREKTFRYLKTGEPVSYQNIIATDRIYLEIEDQIKEIESSLIFQSESIISSVEKSLNQKYYFISIFLSLLVIFITYIGYVFYRRVSRDLDEEVILVNGISESEHKFRNLFDSSIDCLIITDIDGKIIDINKNGYTRLGYSQNEIVGKNISMLVSPNFQSRVSKRLTRINRDGFYQFESEHITKDGKLIPIEVLAHLVNYNGKMRLFSINRNITERKELENSLRNNIARYKAIIETTKEGFIVINLQGQILEVNDSYLKTSGYSREEILMMRFWDLTARENIEKSMGKIHKIFRDGFMQFEGFHETKSQKIWPVEISATFWEENNNLIFMFIRDISERKKYLTSLEEKEEKLRVLFQNAGDEIMILDLEGNIIDINYNGHNRLGYTYEEMVGKSIKNFISEKSAEEVTPVLQELMNKGSMTFEAENVCKDGSLVCLDINAQIIEQGGEKLIFSIGRDISDRKAMEQTLIESENKFRTLFENANDGMHILDLNGNIVDINFKGYSRLGYKKEEMVGHHITEFVPEGTPSRSPGLMNQVLKQGHLTFESAHQHKNGRILPMEINAKVIEQGGQKFFFSVNRDVSLRKELEEILIKREARYRAIIETSADGFWICDIAGNLLEVNDAYVQKSGYSRKELLKKKIIDMEALETEKETADHLQDIAAAGHANFETMHRRKDGSKWPVEIHVTYHKIDNGLFFAFIHDISERKEYIEKLKDNERKFRTMFENANDGLIMLKTDGTIVDINKKGYTRLLFEKEDMIGKKITSFISDGCAERYKDIIPEVIQNESASFECMQIRKDGKTIPVDVNSQLILQNDQKYIFNIARDISARKEFEDILAKRESKYRAVIETSSEGFFIADLEGNIIEVNDAYVQKSGYSRQELKEMNISDLTSDSTPDEIMSRIKKLISTGHDRFESHHVTRWGEKWPVEIIANYWTIEGGRLFVFVIDITERNKTLEMLEESERKFRMMFDNTNDYLMLVSLDGIIQEMNPIGIKNLGYEKDEVIGKPLSTIVASNYSDEISERIRHVDEGFVILESLYMTKDGFEVNVEVNLCVIEKNGQKFHFSLARDITERKIEMKKLKTREALSRAVINRLLDS